MAMRKDKFNPQAGDKFEFPGLGTVNVINVADDQVTFTGDKVDGEMTVPLGTWKDEAKDVRVRCV